MKYRKMFFSEEKNQKTFGLSAWPKGWVASPLAAPGTGKKKLEIALKNDIQPHYFLSRPRAFQLCAVGSGRKVRIWLIISLIVCGLIGSTGGRCAEISLCADAWCPYNCVPGSSRPGMAVEIAQDIFGAAGDQVVYQELNWARCVEDARSGRFTGIIGAIPSDATAASAHDIVAAATAGNGGDRRGIEGDIRDGRRCGAIGALVFRIESGGGGRVVSQSAIQGA